MIQYPKTQNNVRTSRGDEGETARTTLVSGVW